MAFYIRKTNEDDLFSSGRILRFTKGGAYIGYEDRIPTIQELKSVERVNILSIVTTRGDNVRVGVENNDEFKEFTTNLLSCSIHLHLAMKVRHIAKYTVVDSIRGVEYRQEIYVFKNEINVFSILNEISN